MKVSGLVFIVVALGVLFYLLSNSNISELTGIGRRTIETEEAPGPVAERASEEYVPPPITVPPPAEIDQSEIPDGFTRSDLSPFFHKVRITAIDPGSQENYLRVSLAANMSDGDKVNITGWKLRGNRGEQRILGAVLRYPAVSLPTESAIVLGSGEQVHVYSTSSPLGVNIRVNKCMGYLENHYSFDPGIGLGCPALVYPPALYQLSGQCQEYIFSIQGCAEPDGAFPPMYDERECRVFASDIGYRGCVARHSVDADFLLSEWRLWIGGNKFLDFLHDRVLLLDKDGKLVDLYRY